MDPTQPPTPPPPKPRFPFVFVLLTVLFFLSTLFLGYQNRHLRKEITALRPTPTPNPSPLPDPIAGWKTYTNKQIGFSFHYPHDWIINEEQILGSRTEIDFTYNRTTTLALSITANYNNETGQPFQFLDEYIGQQISKAKDITVDGRDAKLVIDPGEEGHVLSYQEAIFFSPKNTTILTLYYQPGYYDIPQADGVLNRILSTFQFIDQTAIITPTLVQTSGKQSNCPSESKGQVCPTICIQPPPYICGSDGKQYCSECQACAGGVAWYTTQNTRCAQ